MNLNLLVLRCKNIEATKNFYEKLGLKFVKEQHGKSPIHYSTEIDQITIELYPLKEGYPVESNRLGFRVDFNDIQTYLVHVGIEIVSEYEFSNQLIVVVVDPDGRKVELSNRPS